MKAILVIDMPTNCKDCDKLVRKGCLKGDYRKEQRPNACPLKPMPQRKEELYYPCNEYVQTFNEGYNRCINEILGDNDE